MQGLLADVNVQGHLHWLRNLLKSVDLWTLLEVEGIRFESFAGIGLRNNLDDRSIWEFCQANGWVLFTNDKNNDGRNSLQATLDDSWQPGHMPVLTLANQGRFVRGGDYSRRVANDVAEILIGLKTGEVCDRPRIYVPV